MGCERTAPKIMAERGWSSVHPAPWRCTTQPDGTPPSPDLIGQDFTACSPGRKLVGDITQIDTWEGPVYLATVIDLFNREVVGYAMADHHRASLVCDAVNTARRKRLIRRRAIFHSDHGSEYTSKGFRKCLRRGRMRQSVGRGGTCHDNAAAESFFAFLKKECVYQTVFGTREQAYLIVVDYIDNFYNTRRLHSTIGYQPPIEARQQHTRNTRQTSTGS